MKKITAIIGSPRGENSTTAKLTKNFLELVREYNPNARYEIIMLDGTSIGYCKGCMACTKIGECVVKDGLQDIQMKIKNSDMVILGSPVYVHGVSAQFKTFADRIFVWLHTLRLIGKPSMMVITTAGSGISPTRKFLNLILYLLGTIPLGRLEANEYFNNDYTSMDFCRRKYEGLAKKVANILNDNKKLKPKLMNNYYFWAMKSKAKFGAQWLPYENKYWESKGWFKMSYNKVFKSL
ncbi:MAG: flavodoxin family protein [Clostridia bacterium]|nr:flavodoxin family protein [Clostridia bacterium]